jgi:hypothetical protein
MAEAFGAHPLFANNEPPVFVVLAREKKSFRIDQASFAGKGIFADVEGFYLIQEKYASQNQLFLIRSRLC